MELSVLQGLSHKKRRERFQLERFIECFAEFPAGKQEWNRESPDLIVHTSRGRLGVEHTTLYTDDLTNEGSRKKNQENLQWRVCDSARAAYEQREPTPIKVTMWFDRAVSLTARTCKPVAAELARAAQKVVSLPGSQVTEDMTRREYERRFADLLPNEILRIRVTRVAHTDFVVWYAAQASAVYELEVSTLEARIQDKEKETRLSEYRQNCDELWLLIGAEGLYPSSNFTVSERLRSHVFQTRFDRVFYFDSFSSDILELKRAS